MEAGEPSRTAMLTATVRGLHRFEVSPPWIFDDLLGLLLVGPEWRDIRTRLGTVFTDGLLRTAGTMLVSRARYAEDRLAAGTFTQYAILGAGLDSFAWRHPDALAGGLRVFEVDHPSTQAWKLNRVESLALPVNERHVYAPVDFEIETIDAGLDRAGFDWSAPAFFSWLGVTPYLTVEAVESTLRSLAKSASGSEIAFTYCLPGSLRDADGAAFADIVSRLVAGYGEPLQTFFAPDEVEALATRCGFEVVDHPSADDVYARYYAGRTDGLTPLTFESFLTARVP